MRRVPRAPVNRNTKTSSGTDGKNKTMQRTGGAENEYFPSAHFLSGRRQKKHTKSAPTLLRIKEYYFYSIFFTVSSFWYGRRICTEMAKELGNVPYSQWKLSMRRERKHKRPGTHFMLLCRRRLRIHLLRGWGWVERGGVGKRMAQVHAMMATPTRSAPNYYLRRLEAAVIAIKMMDHYA
jgi:hypothetical protein